MCKAEVSLLNKRSVSWKKSEAKAGEKQLHGDSKCTTSRQWQGPCGSLTAVLPLTSGTYSFGCRFRFTGMTPVQAVSWAVEAQVSPKKSWPSLFNVDLPVARVLWAPISVPAAWLWAWDGRHPLPCRLISQTLPLTCQRPGPAISNPTRVASLP